MNAISTVGAAGAGAAPGIAGGLPAGSGAEAQPSSSGFQAAAATPEGQATLHRAGFDQSRPPTPRDLLDHLSQRPYGITTPSAQGIETIRGNIDRFLDDAKAAAEAQPGATTASAALGQNTAIKMIHSALATEMPNLQWTCWATSPASSADRPTMSSTG